MAENVIPVDFGREQNDYSRRLSRLLKLADDHAEAVRADPVAFLRRAGDEIIRQREEMRALFETMFPLMPFAPSEEELGHFIPMQTVVIPREDYDRLKACEELVRGWEQKRLVP